MDEATHDKALDVDLDIFGQQPFLRIYTQISLFYPMPDCSLDIKIVKTLRGGLKRLAASFPWLAGQVVNEGACEGNSGVFSIRSFEETPRLVPKLSKDGPSLPSMHQFRAANFPCTMLDEDVLAPRHTLPGGVIETQADPEPVLLVQPTFIDGGLVLTFASHHATMDMTGMGQVMHLLSKACRNEPFTAEELASGNMDRHNIIPILEDYYEPGPELSYQIVKLPPPSDANLERPPPPPLCTWVYFTFSPASLKALKSATTGTLPASSNFISTDDALSALVWQAITRARLPRLPKGTTTTFSRAIDVRRYLNVPATYPGLMQNMTYHTHAAVELSSQPLGVVAAELRAAVDPATTSLTRSTRALATFVRRAADKSGFSFTATVDPSTDLMLSSWSKVDCYGLDFSLGLGDGPEVVRRPTFVPVESLVYLMPKAPDGEIAVMICLRNEDMERLRVDEEFSKYGKYVG